jgi:hypothetical protein
MSERPTLLHENCKECDPDVIRRQLGRWTRLDINARDFLGMYDDLMFTYGGESSARLRKFIVKLNGKDLYEVEVGYWHKRELEWHPLARRSDIDAAMLNEVVRELVKAADEQ